MCKFKYFWEEDSELISDVEVSWSFYCLKCVFKYSINIYKYKYWNFNF